MVQPTEGDKVHWQKVVLDWQAPGIPGKVVFDVTAGHRNIHVFDEDKRTKALRFGAKSRSYNKKDLPKTLFVRAVGPSDKVGDVRLRLRVEAPSVWRCTEVDRATLTCLKVYRPEVKMDGRYSRDSTIRAENGDPMDFLRLEVRREKRRIPARRPGTLGWDFFEDMVNRIGNLGDDKRLGYLVDIHALVSPRDFDIAPWLDKEVVSPGLHRDMAHGSYYKDSPNDRWTKMYEEIHHSREIPIPDGDVAGNDSDLDDGIRPLRTSKAGYIYNADIPGVFLVDRYGEHIPPLRRETFPTPLGSLRNARTHFKSFCAIKLLDEWIMCSPVREWGVDATIRKYGESDTEWEFSNYFVSSNVAKVDWQEREMFPYRSLRR